MSDPPTPEDPYARLDYRRLIAWGPRIQREASFLRMLLNRAPDRSVVDLGCGTGEHTAFFAREGARAIGLDRSEEMLRRAREHEERGDGRFVAGDIRSAAATLSGEPRFGLAISLGNTLPHLLEDDDLRGFLASARDLLLPGALLLIQILNYRGILDRGVRHLPLDFRPSGEGAEGKEKHDGTNEIVFLRLMKPVSDRRILFFPTTLTLDPESEEPVRVERTRRVELRPWTAEELVRELGALGFRAELHGDMEGGAFDPASSRDLVIVAVR
jgi:glycine/sarcosine N-methyltransferase